MRVHASMQQREGTRNFWQSQIGSRGRQMKMRKEAAQGQEVWLAQPRDSDRMKEAVMGTET